MTATLCWSDGAQAFESSIPDIVSLDRALDRVVDVAASVGPVLAVLTLPTGASMSIGLGGPHSVLDHVPAGGDPPYALARMGVTASHPPAFWFQEELSEYPPKAAVSPDAARRALRVFFATGALDDALEWDRS